MSVSSLASSILSAQAGNTQQQIATAVLKSNIDSEKNTVLTILGAETAPSVANAGPGVGGNINVSA
ncbi:MAG TPA: YjfB family protein [Bradyrhizobium sp.]|nr:YjfB family protein [Bradyrhizobium sp.]